MVEKLFEFEFPTIFLNALINFFRSSLLLAISIV